MSYSLTSKRQVTIPLQICEHLGIGPGREIDYITLEDGRVIGDWKMEGQEHLEEVDGRNYARKPWRWVDAMILVDANVLIDIVVAESAWAVWSQEKLMAASNESLAINFVIYAEIAPCFTKKTELDSFLSDLSVRTLSISDHAAYIASRAHQAYRQAGGQRPSTLPDFFIGAHAETSGFRLLTRDPKRIRTYFPRVELVCPTEGASFS
jgi:predicted nucleic acid-binding protein/bifunctional DNA-binding transcriptional regulator/antitoxin component of YhaV-PrlF toxin-antitoxin module